MKGTLLGGFKNWLQDGNGNPLSASMGRVCFFKAGTLAGTSEPLEVYNSASMDVPLGTIVYPDAKGYLPDIWLRSDFLYDIRVERKMQSDPELWVKEYDVYNAGEIIDDFEANFSNNSIFVENISALKAVDFHKYGYAYVAGYHEAGDWGEPSVFRYDTGSSATPDNAAYVLPSSITAQSTGRWVQQFSNSIIDVRKFGAIPDKTDVLDVTTQIVNCITYCINASKFKKPVTIGFLKPGTYYISGTLDLSQYAYTQQGGTSIKAHFIINDSVVFCNSLDSATVLKLSSSTTCLSNNAIVSGNISLLVEENSKDVNPIWWGTKDCIVNNCMIVANRECTNGIYLNGCEIQSNHSFNGTVSLTNCVVKEEYFKSSYNYSNASFNNCKISSISEWVSVSNWIKAKKKNGDHVYDFCGESVSDVSINTTGSIFIKNAGTLSIGCSQAGTVYYSNVDALSITSLKDLDGVSINIEGCTVYSVAKANNKVNISVSNCNVVGKIDVGGNVSAISSKITEELHGYDVILNGCNTGTKSVYANNSFICTNSNIGSLVAYNASIVDSNVNKFVEKLKMDPYGEVEIGLWVSKIVNSNVGTLNVENHDRVKLGVCWIDSTIGNLTFKECTAKDDAFCISNCNVTTLDGRVYRNEYKINASFTPTTNHQLTCEIPNFLSFMIMAEADESGEYITSDSKFPVIGVVNFSESDGSDTDYYSRAMYESPLKSFVYYKGGKFYVSMCVHHLLLTASSFSGTAVFDVLR